MFSRIRNIFDTIETILVILTEVAAMVEELARKRDVLNR